MNADRPDRSSSVPLGRWTYPPGFYAYTTALVVIAAWSAFPGLARVPDTWHMTLVWLMFIAAATLFTVPMLPNVSVDVSLGTPVCAAAAVVLDPRMAVLVTFLGFTSQREIRRNAPVWLSLFNRAQAAVAGGLAAVVAHAVAPPGGAGLMLPLVIATAAAALTFDVVNTVLVLVSVQLRSRRRIPLPQALQEGFAPFPRFSLDFLLLSSLALLVVVTYVRVGAWAVLLLSFPLRLGYSALDSARESEDRARELADQVRELETLNDLGGRLLSIGSLDQVRQVSEEALCEALGTADVAVVLDGDVSADLHVMKIPGAEPAAIGAPVHLSEGSLAIVEAVARLVGVTVQRIALAHELDQVQRARIALSGQILEEGTRERSRIALEIHDEVLPFLAAAEIQADNVRSALNGGLLDRALPLATQMGDAVHDGIARLREVLDDLRRQIITPGSLVPGLGKALDDLQLRHGVDASLHVPDELPPLPLAVEILLLETVRGCLANVAGHANARAVTVTVALEDTLIVAKVCDDGLGFVPTAPRPGSQGLELMEQRVKIARGRFAVTSAPGAGTCVLVEVPR